MFTYNEAIFRFSQMVWNNNIITTSSYECGVSLLVSLIPINKILLFLTIMFIINFMLHWKFARIVNCSWVFVFAFLEGSGRKILMVRMPLPRG